MWTYCWWWTSTSSLILMCKCWHRCCCCCCCWVGLMVLCSGFVMSSCGEWTMQAQCVPFDAQVGVVCESYRIRNVVVCNSEYTILEWVLDVFGGAIYNTEWYDGLEQYNTEWWYDTIVMTNITRVYVMYILSTRHAQIWTKKHIWKKTYMNRIILFENLSLYNRFRFISITP